jgi:hypothetical protein
MRPAKVSSVGRYMRGIRSQTARGRIRGLYKQFCAEKGLTPYGAGFGRQRRELVQAALFRVEDDWESRGGGRVHPVVDAIHAARMRVELDMGWSDP